MPSTAASAARAGEARVEGESEKNVGGGLLPALPPPRWGHTAASLAVAPAEPPGGCLSVLAHRLWARPSDLM